MSFYPVTRHVVDMPRIRAAAVMLVRVDIDLDARLDHPAFAVLSDDERAYAARFLRHQDAVRYSATRLALRDTLGERLGMAAHALRFEKDGDGRPRVAHHADVHVRDALDFNVSHAGRHAMIAVARGRRVGVDIEARDRVTDWRALASAVFASRDAQCVAALRDDLRGDAFYDVWTAKEALLKALGTGLKAGMSYFSVLGGGGGGGGSGSGSGDGDGDGGSSSSSDFPVARLAQPPSNGRLQDATCVTSYDAAWCPAPPGYSACVAWSRDIAATP